MTRAHPHVFRAMSVLLAGLILALAHCAAAQDNPASAHRRVTFAVLPFEVKAREAVPPFEGQVMAEALTTALGNLGRFRLVNRTEIERVLEELGLSESGLISRDEQKRFGELASVDIIVSGSVSILASDLYWITAVFTNVSTSEIADQAMIQATGPTEFDDVARAFATRARDRFPLLGQVREIASEGAYVNLGLYTGLTEVDRGGTIYRLRERAGSVIKIPIGEFEIVAMYEDLTLIRFQLSEDCEQRLGDADSCELRVGDEVSIDDVSTTAVADPEPEVPEPVPDAEPRVEEPAMGAVNVTTGGVPADVYLDGRLLGRSPITIPGVSAGTHTVRLDAELHEPVETTIVVVAGETFPLAETLVAVSAELILEVDAPEYEVTVDGEARASSGAIRLAPGNYDVRVIARGRQAMHFTVDLAPGETLRRDVRLLEMPALGLVTVRDAPIGTAITAVNIANDEVVELPAVADSPETYELEFGRYRMEAMAPGVGTQVVDVEVTTDPVALEFPGQLSVGVSGLSTDLAVLDSAGEVYRGATLEDLSLPPGRYTVVVLATGELHEVVIESLTSTRLTIAAPGPAGWLFVTSQPSGVAVYVDDVRVGETPLSLPEVPVGVRRLRLEADGYQTSNQTITVTPGGPQRLSVLLQPIQ